jgi:hypothetical protein
MRPDFVDAFMPFAPMHRFGNIAFAFIDPPAVAPSTLLRRAFQSVAGNPRVRLAPSSQGSQIVIFDDVDAREATIHHSPFIYRGHTVPWSGSMGPQIVSSSSMRRLWPCLLRTSPLSTGTMSISCIPCPPWQPSLH